jgi:cation diffusion facilitator CzcD-associated flavoprotein CzcO
VIEHVDVLVVGAGISGIGAGYYLQDRCPDHSFAILEGRGALGGTWDLFRYPGIRSDSDMFTLGYAFRPWTAQKAIADGDAILEYLNETVDAYDLRQRIRFHHRVVSASWSSREARWTVTVDRVDRGDTVEISCNFLFMCSGYYDYERGYTPEIAGRDRFTGTMIHPQHWPSGFDHAGQRIVIIGSGATAVTLAPVLAERAEKVIVLQRSPTYIVSRPSVDAAAEWLRARLPTRLAYTLTRWKNVLLQAVFFQLSRRAPDRVREWMREGVVRALGRDYDVDTHFAPRYNPWDQRVCLVPDGDLFAAIRAGSVEMVTDHIECFTETGIRLRSGEHLDAEAIVTATGLELRFMTGLELTVDGRAIVPSELLTYKAMMFSDVPNLALSFGYTNASWTLKSDLTGEFVCRLLRHMRRGGYRRCVPRPPETLEEVPFLDFTSGYVQRAVASMPRQGARRPWKLAQNYLFDILEIRHGRIDDGVMEFS